MKVSIAPVIKGAVKLSLNGSGKLSIIIAMVAPTSALNGLMKNAAARKAKKKPLNVPSKVFALLKGKMCLPNTLPKIEAVLSPTANTAIAALLAGAGKTSRVSPIPRAKNMGETANVSSSPFLAAQCVIKETIGKLFPLILAHSDKTYKRVTVKMSMATMRKTSRLDRIGMKNPQHE